MKTSFSFLVAVSLLLGSAPRTPARTIDGDRIDARPFPSILQNRDCRGDNTDDCK
jgi:hypothetical protein